MINIYALCSLKYQRGIGVCVWGQYGCGDNNATMASSAFKAHLGSIESFIVSYKRTSFIVDEST